MLSFRAALRIRLALLARWEWLDLNQLAGRMAEHTGSSCQMTTVPVSADYDQTVGAMNRYRESTVSTWPGDRFIWLHLQGGT